MSDYILSCCSTADLSKEHFDEKGIKYIFFHYYLDGVHYRDDLGQSIPFKEFYERIAAGADTTTSQVNTDEFEEYFTPFLEDGKDIVHVCLSSGLSGVYNSAMIAKENLEKKYPGRKIYVVDSLGASSGYGLLMDTLAEKKEQGMGAEELAKWAEENKLYVHHWFFSTDLTWYVKGGRISKASGWFGTVLHICPLLNMDDKGHLVPRYKLRGKKRVIEAIVKKMEECARDGHDYDGKCFISMSNCYDDAREVADRVEKAFPKLNGKVEIYDIGTTIGSHTGPGTVALFFWGNKRTD